MYVFTCSYVITCRYVLHVDGSDVNVFDWGEGEPNNMRSAGEDAINLLQEMKFRWNDNNPASVLEYDECNKYLCECEYN